MSFRRAPISVFIAITPTFFSLAFVEKARQLGLQGDEMKGVAQAGDELRVLAEAVGDQHHVDQVLLDRVVQAFGEPAAVPRHTTKADLALRLGALGERPPLLVFQARDVVHGVIEVDVQVVGLQAPEAAFQSRHHVGLRVALARLTLGAEHHPITGAAQAFTHCLLRPAEAIALGRVEQGDAAIQRMAHQIGIVGAGRAEADLGHLESGAPQGDVAPDSRTPGVRRRCDQRRHATAHGRGATQSEELASVDHDM